MRVLPPVLAVLAAGEQECAGPVWLRVVRLRPGWTVIRALNVAEPAVRLDRANEGVPLELIELMTTAGKLRPVRVLALTVTRPRLLPRALALGQATRRALTAVARVLAGLAASPRP